MFVSTGPVLRGACEVRAEAAQGPAGAAASAAVHEVRTDELWNVFMSATHVIGIKFMCIHVFWICCMLKRHNALGYGSD